MFLISTLRSTPLEFLSDIGTLWTGSLNTLPNESNNNNESVLSIFIDIFGASPLKLPIVSEETFLIKLFSVITTLNIPLGIELTSDCLISLAFLGFPYLTLKSFNSFIISSSIASGFLSILSAKFLINSCSFASSLYLLR